jgi:hypothetical protein
VPFADCNSEDAMLFLGYTIRHSSFFLIPLLRRGALMPPFEVHSQVPIKLNGILSLKSGVDSTSNRLPKHKSPLNKSEQDIKGQSTLSLYLLLATFSPSSISTYVPTSGASPGFSRCGLSWAIYCIFVPTV